jgi:hypothetical protein
MREKELEKRLDELKSALTAPRLKSAKKEVVNFGQQMQAMKRGEPGYIELREKVRAAIMNAVSTIRVYFARHRDRAPSGFKRETMACLGVVAFTDGSMRLFACRRSRWHYQKEPPTAFIVPYALKFIAPQWQRLADALARGTPTDFHHLMGDFMALCLRNPKGGPLVPHRPQRRGKKPVTVEDILLDR